MTRTLVSALALALAGAACSHGSGATPGSTSQPAASTSSAPAAGSPSAGMAGMCPMNVPGTQVSASDTPSGAALTFTTTPEQAPALREKVAAMAEMHNRHHGTAGGPGAQGRAAGSAGMGGMSGEHGMHGGMGGHGAAGMQMPPPSTASVEEVEGGARLVLTPNDPADLQQLQATVRAHAERMQRDGCPMMGRDPQG